MMNTDQSAMQMQQMQMQQMQMQQPMQMQGMQQMQPELSAKDLEKQARQEAMRVQQEEKAREKEARKQKNLEQQRLAQEAKAKRKAEAAERAELLEQERSAKREQKRLQKEANIEKMRLAKEAKQAKKEERMANAAERKKVNDEAARIKAESTVVVTLNQQTLLDQIRAIAESSSPEASVGKVGFISFGSHSQLSIGFATAEQARAFMVSGADQKGLSINMSDVRPLPIASRTVHFPFDFTPHGERAAATEAVIGALKQANIAFAHAALKGAYIAIEFATDEEADRSCGLLNKGVCSLGGTVLGVGAVVGNVPKQGKKRKSQASEEQDQFKPITE